ncbi:hypothetical protein [Sulfuricurvum sp.]|uniref:hypothetical protein n=1 Tax=Sulfuricurvum sp. TaxID=2025608 RepID=UPI003C39F4FB
MKKLALIMMFSVASVVLSAEEYTIQTISALKESSITPAFEKKVQKSALSSAQKKEGNCNIVTVGSYPTPKAATSDIQKAKAISKDAFVRPTNRTVPQVCLGKNNTHTTALQDTNPSAVESKQDAVALKENTAAAKVVQETSQSALSAKVQPCVKGLTAVYLCDRNLARKSDIHEAIEYYKNSPYHSFQPIALQK